VQAREVCDSASIAAKHVLERSGAEADPVCQGEDGGVIARSCKVVDEGRVLRQERVCCYIECMLEKGNRGKLWSEDEVGHGGRGWRRRPRSDTPTRHRFLTTARVGF